MPNTGVGYVRLRVFTGRKPPVELRRRRLVPEEFSENVIVPLALVTGSAHTPVTADPNMLPKKTFARDLPPAHQTQLPFCKTL